MKYLLSDNNRTVEVNIGEIAASSVVHIYGTDIALNQAIALTACGVNAELLEETNYKISQLEPLGNGSIDNVQINYIGPYFRSEISGFWDTVEKEVLTGNDKKDIRGDKIFEILRIKELQDRNPKKLSGGETARVVIASHLLSQPNVLVLDRVVEELDIVTRRSIMANVCDLIGSGILIITGNEKIENCDYIISTDATVVSEVLCEKTQPLCVGNNDQQLAIVKRAFTTKSGGCCIILNGFSVCRDGAVIVQVGEYEANGGELIVVTGKNGSGKTTLIEGMVGLLETRGGHELRKDGEKNDSIGLYSYSPQDPTCDITEYSMQEEIWLACESKTVGQQLIASWKLPKHYICEKLSENISLQKMASVLGALIRGKACCFLDEPTLYLNVEQKRLVINAILSNLREGRIVFCSSHDTEIIQMLN